MIEIRQLKPGEKITEPGFYNIPLHVHHNQPCDGVSVTSGVLRGMDPDLGSPADVWAFHKLNPDGRKKPASRAMHQGAAMAALIAGGGTELQRQFFVADKKVPRRPSEQQWDQYHRGRLFQKTTLDACEYWEEVNNGDRPHLTYDDTMLLVDMAKVLQNDAAAMAAIAGLPEITMAAYDEQTDLWLLSRPDTVDPDHAAMSDYKKISTRGEPFTARILDERICRFGYDAQMGFAADVYSRLTGNWPENVGIIGQSDAYPYHVIPRALTEQQLVEGMQMAQLSAKRFRQCLDSGHWPGPGEDIGEYRRPDWRQKQIERQFEREGIQL